MLVGIDKKEVVKYTVEADRESEKPTVFIIGHITNKQKTELFSDLMTEGGQVDKNKAIEKVEVVLKCSLKGIENFCYPGQIEPVNITEITDDVIAAIPFQALYEVAGEAIKLNFTVGEIRKN